MKLFLTVLIVCCSILGAMAQAHHMKSDTARTVNPVLAPNPPLFILNGKVVRADSARYILPEDIQSIEVLKGEKAQLAYGERGKNGVLVITLKDLTKFRSFNKRNKNR